METDFATLTGASGGLILEDLRHNQVAIKPITNS